jgi:hypothetical protein
MKISKDGLQNSMQKNCVPENELPERLAKQQSEKQK